MFHTGEGTFTSDALATLVALALLALPVALGLQLGALVRRHLRRRALRWPLLLALAGAPLALAGPLVARSNTSLFWDVLFAALCFLPAVLLGRDGARTRVALQLVLGAMLAEVALRMLTPPAVSPAPHMARLSMEITNRDPPCRVLYPDPDALRSESEVRDGRPVVMHLGDSMVEGAGVAREEAFPAALGALQPAVRHVNLGVGGAGPEAYLFAFERWVSALRPRLAVVYIFLGNDIFDLEREYLCCAGGPLYRDAAVPPTPRCPTARWAVPLKTHLVTSPAPFALRALAANSAAAWHLQRLVQSVPDRLYRRGFHLVEGAHESASLTPRWDLFARRLQGLARASAAHRVPVLVVALPSRHTLERALGREPHGFDYWGDRESGEAAQRRVVTEARAVGLDALDAAEPVRAGIALHGLDAFFANQYPGDVHFSPLGHRAVAAWLAPALAERLARSGTVAAP